MPGSGSLTRSAINHQAGAVSRWSGLIAAGTVGLILFALADKAQFIPKAVLAGILLVTAWRLLDRSRIQYCLRASRLDAFLALLTAFSVVFLSVEYAILIGTFASFLLIIPRTARLRRSELVLGAGRSVRERRVGDPVCTKMAIYSLEGEMFFGAAPDFERYLKELEARVEQGARVLILRLRMTRHPDMVCMEIIERFLRKMMAKEIPVLLSGLQGDWTLVMKRLRFHHWFPQEWVFAEDPLLESATLRAVRSAYEMLEDDLCPTCPRREEATPQTDAWYYVI